LLSGILQRNRRNSGSSQPANQLSWQDQKVTRIQFGWMLGGKKLTKVVKRWIYQGARIGSNREERVEIKAKESETKTLV